MIVKPSALPIGAVASTRCGCTMARIAAPVDSTQDEIFFRQIDACDDPGGLRCFFLLDELEVGYGIMTDTMSHHDMYALHCDPLADALEDAFGH